MWDDINKEPFLYQPHYPNMDSFDSKEEAEIWAKYKLEELTIEEAPEAPLGKGLPAEPKPTLMQQRERSLARLGLTVDDLKALLGLNA
jgi:hypothetical protein